MSVWQYYRSLNPRTRLFIGVGAMAYAGFGLLMSDTAEKVFDLTPTEADTARLESVIPKVRAVDKDEIEGLRER